MESQSKTHVDGTKKSLKTRIKDKAVHGVAKLSPIKIAIPLGISLKNKAPAAAKLLDICRCLVSLTLVPY